MGKVHVITGGTGGMGIAIAEGFAKNACVLLADMSEERLQGVKLELEQQGFTNIHTTTCNVTIAEEVQSLAEQAKQLGQLGSIIHTAGVSPASFGARAIFDINLRGTVLVLDAFEKIIEEGSVAVCIASMSAHISPVIEAVLPILENPLAENFLDDTVAAVGDMAQAAYPISKKFVVDLVEKRGTAWGEKGGRIVSISPGLIMTPMGEKEAENEATSARLVGMNPLNRFGNPSEIADAVHFLISDKASYVNGTDLKVDGGVTAVLQKAMQLR